MHKYEISLIHITSPYDYNRATSLGMLKQQIRMAKSWRVLTLTSTFKEI